MSARRKSTVPRPSIAEAAHYLRHLADIAELPAWRPPAQTDDERKLMQLRLRTVADCIEGSCDWRKGSALPMEKQDLLRAVTRWTPKAGVTLSAHLTDVAQVIANQWRWYGVREGQVADHVTPHRGNAELFAGPLQTLCRHCHAKRKQQLDPLHPWHRKKRPVPSGGINEKDPAEPDETLRNLAHPS